MKRRNIIFGAVLSVLVSFALCQQLQAQDSPDPGGVPGLFSTADGDHALFNNDGAFANSGFGWFASFANAGGNFNTAVGAAALDLNGFNDNTAVGAAAALFSQGNDNTAVGAAALENNNQNGNTATGAFALFANTTGPENVAVGFGAMLFNGLGGFSTAVGFQALLGSTGAQNTAVGDNALAGLGFGFQNTAIGDLAGNNYTGTESNNVLIGPVGGFTGENNAIHINDSTNVLSGGPATDCFIGGIFGSVVNNVGVAVFVDSFGKLTPFPSSARFKEDIKPMDKASELIFALKPITFRYKKEFGATRIRQFGLVAEEVAKVDPDLVVPDRDGKPYAVRYEQVNAMLLNEFLKEHKKVEEQQASIGELKNEVQTVVAQLKEQAAQIQKVSAQLEVNKTAAKVVVNKP